jgi:hypothetical protein
MGNKAAAKRRDIGSDAQHTTELRPQEHRNEEGRVGTLSRTHNDNQIGIAEGEQCRAQSVLRVLRGSEHTICSCSSKRTHTYNDSLNQIPVKLRN